MTEFELAQALFRKQDAGGMPSTKATKVYGYATSDSADGSVTVVLYSDAGGEDAEMEVPTLGGITEGAEVMVTLLDGTPVDCSQVGSIDTVTTVAVDAKAVADATAQHVWTDDSGLHVTEVTQEEWVDEQGSSYHSGMNVLLNSLGQLFRTGLTNLLGIVSGATPSISIYDGAGNTDGNVVAKFSGDSTRIGKTDGSHIELDDSSMSLYGWDTTDEVSRLAASIRVQHIIGQAAGGVIETDVVSASNVYTDGVSIFNTGIHVGRSGERLISSINHGHVEAVTNSNGVTTFDPGLWAGDPAQNVAPTWVQVTHVKAASETEAVAKIAVPMVWSIDSPTQVQVRWQRTDTGAWLASNRVGFDWLAIYSA